MTTTTKRDFMHSLPKASRLRPGLESSSTASVAATSWRVRLSTRMTGSMSVGAWDLDGWSAEGEGTRNDQPGQGVPAVTAVATYGTLRAGEQGWPIVARHVRRLEPCVITDASIFDFDGRFPLLVDSPGFTVAADLIILDPSVAEYVMHMLDVYEGVPDLYRRELRSVDTEHATVKAWVYVATRIPLGLPLIESGDWVAHVHNH